MTTQQLQQLKNTMPAHDDRVDIRGVVLDPDMPAAQRAEQYLQQVKNPYHFRVGDIAVNVQFASERPLKDAVVSYLINLKNAG
ncbi:MAG: hypothetical protein FWE40_07285 [Oscillospiraceae bacterium]|nr:hypothetical protein [Oscillospiraceae bacterium]